MRNYLSNLEDFVAAWDAPRPPPPAAALGGPGLPILVPRQAGFEAAIESGIRPLVLVMATHLNWITYSSCEGHRGETAFSEREIGLLPRGNDEYAAIYDTLLAAIDATAAISAPDGATLALRKGFLWSRECRSPIIDLIFLAGQADADAYFAWADQATHHLTSALRAAPAANARQA